MADPQKVYSAVVSNLPLSAQENFSHRKLKYLQDACAILVFFEYEDSKYLE